MAASDVLVGGLTHEVWDHYPRPDPDTTVPAAGVERLTFDDTTGELRRAGTAATGLRSPQYLEPHPTLPVLYAAEFATSARLVAHGTAADGALKPLSAVASLGTMAAAVAVHPDGGFAYVGHLVDGVLTVVELDADGNPGPTQPLPPDPGAQLHHLRVTPDGSLLLVTDFGRDELAVHPLDSGRPAGPARRIIFPTGSRPRHLALDPSGRAVYVVGEGDATLYVLEARDHVPTAIRSTHHLGAGSPSELHLHPDGGTLFVGVRKADAIVSVEVDGVGGARVRATVRSGGRSPRTLAVHPGGRHLLVGNWHSNELVVFGIDGNHRLGPAGRPVPVPSPSSILFAGG
ncbi:lactonase family protein [Pseudonocardia kujensis]|uniref:lactonase family protein n=1 Tax=Pseudonocardia kujensis TaxID=1128675 RepID=UPI001E404E9D|nr:beta-propeller fold lactonase family protein [Pseudonocardia kujensis]MCE0765972.1 lactonase family protein [Pseudonocardia kujensis]